MLSYASSSTSIENSSSISESISKISIESRVKSSVIADSKVIVSLLMPVFDDIIFLIFISVLIYLMLSI